MNIPGSYANGFAPRDGIPLYPQLWKGCIGALAPCLGPSGTHLRDWSGFGNHGTLTNGPTWEPNYGRYSLRFDGTDDYIVISPGPVPSINPAPLSASMWVNVSSTGSHRGFFDINTNGASDTVMALDKYSDDTWRMYVKDVYRTGGTVTIGWHHVVAILEDNTGTSPAKMYVDGVLVIDSVSTGAAPNNTPQIIIGDHTFANAFDSNLDDVRVYNRVLSPPEIALLASRRGIAYELDRSVAVIEVAAEDLIVGDTSMAWSVNYRENGSDVVKHVFAWVSAADGTATVPSSIPVSGRIERVVIVPSASAAPTSLYDVTLTDSNSIDVLAGQGANLSATVSSSVCPGTPLKDGTTVSVTPTAVDSILTLNVTNAGNTKSGTVVVYVR